MKCCKFSMFNFNAVDFDTLTSQLLHHHLNLIFKRTLNVEV